MFKVKGKSQGHGVKGQGHIVNTPSSRGRSRVRRIASRASDAVAVNREIMSKQRGGFFL